VARFKLSKSKYYLSQRTAVDRGRTAVWRYVFKSVVNFTELVINPPTATNFDGEVSSGSGSLQVFFFIILYIGKGREEKFGNIRQHF
jgi:hypothetical protein